MNTTIVTYEIDGIIVEEDMNEIDALCAEYDVIIADAEFADAIAQDSAE